MSIRMSDLSQRTPFHWLPLYGRYARRSTGHEFPQPKKITERVNTLLNYLVLKVLFYTSLTAFARAKPEAISSPYVFLSYREIASPQKASGLAMTSRLQESRVKLPKQPCNFVRSALKWDGNISYNSACFDMITGGVLEVHYCIAGEVFLEPIETFQI